jgi:hypothetical protein
MSKKRIRTLLLPGILLILLIGASILYAYFLLQRPSVQQLIVEKISHALGYDVKVKTVHVSFTKGLAITATGLSASSQDQKQRIVAATARIGLRWKALFKGNVIPRSVDLTSPVITLSLPDQDKIKRWSWEEMLQDMELLKIGAIRSLAIKAGQLEIEGSPFSLRALFLTSSRQDTETRDQTIQLKTALRFKEDAIPFEVHGHVRWQEGQPGMTVDLSGTAGNIPVSWVPWPSFASFSGGTIDAVYHVTGPLTDTLAARGSFRGRNLRFAISERKRKKEYALSSLSLDFNANLNKEEIDIQIPQATLLDTTLRGRISYTVAEPSPRLDLSLQSPFMPLQTFKSIFPSPLVPAWIERDLFPRLSKGEVRADHFSLAGTLEQIAHLNRPENADLIAMQLIWKELHIPTERSPLPFESVAGMMEIKHNRLTLSELRGRFGTSAIDDASLHVTPLVGKRHRYRIILGGDFALKDLLAMRELPWTPRDIKEKAAGLEGSSGRMTGRLEVVNQGPGTVRIKNGSLNFDHCTFLHYGSLFPVKITNGTMKILESGKLEFEGRGSWGQSALAFSGFSDWSLTHLETAATGTLDIDALTQRAFPGKHWPLRFGKPVGCALHISRKGSIWSCGGKIDLADQPALNIGSLYLNPLGKKGRICFALDYTPGKELHLKNLDAGFGKSFFSASGRAAFRGERRITAQITTPGLYLEDLGVQFRGTCPIPTGVLTGTMQGSFPLEDLLSSTVTGELEASGLCFTLKKLPQPLSVSGFKAAFSGDTVNIKSLHVTAGSSSLALQGHLQGWKTLRGNLEVQSTHIEVNDFLPEKKKPQEKKAPFFLQPLLDHSAGLGISFKINNLAWRKLQMGPLSGEGVLDKGALHILRSSLKLEHGFITMKGDLSGDTQKEITFLSQIRFYEQPVQKLFPIFNREEYYIEGQLSSDILLSGQGHDKASLVASLQGKGKVLLEKGTIKKSSVLIKILDFLSIQKIFRRPPPNLSKEGFYYDKIGADFVIRKGTLFTENLLMRSPVINGAGKGRIDFSTKQTRADLGVQPLVALDSMVSKIPIVGYILTGKDKTLLVYYFKVEGPFSSPEVTYIPLKQWGNSLMGYITRIFLTPPRLFEKLMHLRKPSPNQSIQSDADDRQQKQSGDSRR